MAPPIQGGAVELAACCRWEATFFLPPLPLGNSTSFPARAKNLLPFLTLAPFGLFEYLFMPFGLRNAAQTFQRFMDSLFKQLPFLFCYLDDLIIASHTLEEHLKHLRQIFTILQENGLQINPAKCVFAAATMVFLGHRWTSTASDRSSGMCKPLVNFPPLRM
jgi:hypothetical protein